MESKLSRASRTAPASAQNMGMVKIGRFDVVKCRPYAVWDDVPAVADKLKKTQRFETGIRREAPADDLHLRVLFRY